ncbi:MAG: thioredoxin family protein [Akkermansia sp.]|uniref:thioredoxin family protein n=1 Tax=Akkermansia sp. TaxID=1872421 RepID=UPI00259B6ACB|nr:thioredoxin family protein [uncultured Akkermansia sp.]
MIRQILPIVVAACIAPCFAAEGWLTDMDAAKKEAAEQKKDLMIEFTGSDWCPPCMQLRANVFSKPDFQKEAQKNFVLLELDYPRSKEQSAEVKAANQKLAEQYGVTGFPTVVFADASGKPFGGFVGGRPREDVMKAMQDALKNKEALQAAEAEVAKASTDEARAVALMEVFKLAPKDYVDNFYGDVKAEIKKLDKDDKSGLKAADAHADQLKKEQKEVQDYLAGKMTANTTPAEALQVVKSYPNRDKLLPETQQELLMMEFGTFLNSTGDVDGAVLILDKVAELKPGTEAGQQAPRIKAGILANKDRIKAQIEAAKKAQNK